MALAGSREDGNSKMITKLEVQFKGVNKKHTFEVENGSEIKSQLKENVNFIAFLNQGRLKFINAHNVLWFDIWTVEKRMKRRKIKEVEEIEEEVNKEKEDE